MEIYLDDETLEMLNVIADYNGMSTDLTIETLIEIEFGRIQGNLK